MAAVTRPGERAGRRGLTYGALAGLLVVAAAAVIGTRQLGDNSFLTHLTTGRSILDEGRIPTRDVYSFTAPDTPWVVQSWLASVVYALVERLGGGLGLRLLHASLTVGTGALLWRLSRPIDGLLARLGLVAIALAIGAQEWAERPFMFACIFLGVYLVGCQRALPGPLLAVIGWLWVNTHGSFPLGLVAVAAVAVGQRLDGAPSGPELKTLRWATGGMLAAAINPLGPKLLWFPIDLLGRQEILREVVEWQAPDFVEAGDRAFLLLLVVAVVALVRAPTWRATVPTVVFAVAALLGTRNMVFGSMVLVAACAPGLAGIGTLRTSTTAPRGGAVVAGVLVALSGLLLVSAFTEDHYNVSDRYPVRAIGLFEQEDVDLTEHHLVSLDIVGNLLTSLYPDDRVVYFDDRFDMYPEEVAQGNLRLLRGRAGWRTALEEVDADLVIWSRQQPLSQLLAIDPGWRTVLVEDDWVTFCRRGADLPQLGC